MGVEGWVTANLELGSIDDEVEALVVPELKAEMIIGLRSLKEHECSLDFQCDNLWTGRKEGSIVPLQYEILKVTSFPKHPPEDDNYWDINLSHRPPQLLPAHSTPLPEPHTPRGGSNVESSYAMGDVVEGLPSISQNHEVQGMQEEGSMDFQVQAKRHLDEDIEKILELAAPEVTGTERDRLKQLISTYRDVFALTDAELGQTKLVTHRIDTGDSAPIKIPPSNISRKIADHQGRS